MSTELYYLAATSLLTAIIWMPYAVNFIMTGGLQNAVGPHEEVEGMAGWAIRMKKAHTNAIENLVVFAPLVLVVHVSGASSEMTALACMVFFWARLIHLITYTLGIPWVRTLAFAAGFACQVTLALSVL